MKNQISPRRMTSLLLVGILGCILMGGSDWLMIYGDPTYKGELAWLTLGVAGIAPGRNALSLLLAFPAVICYSFALFAVKRFLTRDGDRHTYSMLTTLGLTPWLCIHLFYVMILYLFAWMLGNGAQDMAYAACEALFRQFRWIIPLGEVLMLLPFVYLLVQTVRGKSVFPRWAALNHPLLHYVVLKLLISLMPDTAFGLAFTNGLMSEAMLLWFVGFILLIPRYYRPEAR